MRQAQGRENLATFGRASHGGPYLKPEKQKKKKEKSEEKKKEEEKERGSIMLSPVVDGDGVGLLALALGLM